jgi:hypothetical protein
LKLVLNCGFWDYSSEDFSIGTAIRKLKLEKFQVVQDNSYEWNYLLEEELFEGLHINLEKVRLLNFAPWNLSEILDSEVTWGKDNLFNTARLKLDTLKFLNSARLKAYVKGNHGDSDSD